jgi:transcriptional regulator with XRE-family HTH domain
MADIEREARGRFAANVERLRRRDGLSVESLAERSRIDGAELGKILRGEIEVGYRAVALLAGALGVQPGELFAGIRWIPPGEEGGGTFEIEPPP